MATEGPNLPSTPPRPPLDRLSLLPNELLVAIFDLAYPVNPPKLPLSKRLRPFQERQLYRDFTLSSVDQFHALTRALDLDPTRGALVDTIEIVSKPCRRNDPSRVSLDDLLSKLPNLVSLYLPVGPNLYKGPTWAVMSRLSRVTHVAATVHTTFANDSPFRISDLACLSALPNLDTLDVADPFALDRNVDSCTEAVRFRSVETLRLTERIAGEATVVQLVDLCPNLVHFDLSSGSSRPDLRKILPLLPPTLQSLRLDTRKEPGRPTFCDPFLPQFRQLRRLDLADGCFSPSIDTTLAQLPNLVAIRLGHGTAHYRGLASLASGPTRLVALKSITLETATSVFGDLGGDRTRAPSDPSFSAPSALTLDHHLSEWVSPSEFLPDPVGLRTLMEACKSSGVKLGGTLFHLFKPLEEWYIEANNRAVLRAAASGRDRDFRRLRRIQSDALQRAGVSLPSFDLDSLDPDRLEVVETELPEKEWFVLSLRNKARSEDT